MRKLALLLLPLVSTQAHATGCVSPAGVQGELRWNSPIVQFCDGNAWQTTVVTTTGTTCSVAGEIKFTSGAMTFCNGSVLIQMNGATNGTCTAAQSGSFQFDGTNHRPQYCNGTNWIAMQPGPQISVAQSAQVDTTQSGSTFPLPAFSSSVLTGSTIICYLGGYFAGSTLTSVADTAGNTYTRILTPQTTAWDSWIGELWYAQNVTGGASFKVTGTYSSSINGKSGGAICSEIRGATTSNALDQYAYTTGATDSAAGNTFSTTSAKELLWVATVESNLCTNASGWTTIAGSFGDLVEYKTISTAGSVSTPTSTGCGAHWAMYSVSIRSQ